MLPSSSFVITTGRMRTFLVRQLKDVKIIFFPLTREETRSIRQILFPLKTLIRAILTAKALGIPTYYEVDDLIFDAAHYPDTFESYEDQISKAEYNGLLYGVPLFNYAGLCEHGIASTMPLARHIEPIAKSRDCLVLRNGLDERNEKAIGMGRAPRPGRDTVSIFYGSGTKPTTAISTNWRLPRSSSP